MSNELRGSRVSHLKKENESEENKSLALETSMLIKSSKIGGEVNLGDGGDESSVAIEQNYFIGAYKRERTRSLDALMDGMDINQLSDWSNDSFDRKHLDLNEMKKNCKIILGVGAESALLEQPATPTTPRATKRLYSPEKKTPRGRPRKFSTSQMGSSALRLNLISIAPDGAEHQEDTEDGKIRMETPSTPHERGVMSSRGRVQEPSARAKELTSCKPSDLPIELSRGRVVEGNLTSTELMVDNSGHSNGPKKGGISCDLVESGGNLTSALNKKFILQTPRNKRIASDKLNGRNAKSTPRRRRTSIKENEKGQWKISQLFPKDIGGNEVKDGGAE